MKRLILILFLIISIISYAQPPYQTNNLFGTQSNRGLFLYNLGLPKDTFAVPAQYRSWAHLATAGVTHDSIYRWSPTLLKWVFFSTGSGGGGGGPFVTSVDASFQNGDAVVVTGGPITTNGTLNFAWQGLTSEYIRGDGSRASLHDELRNIGDSIYSRLGHSHVFSDITDGTNAVRGLFNVGSGLSYNAATGTFSVIGGGTGSGDGIPTSLTTSGGNIILARLNMSNLTTTIPIPTISQVIGSGNALTANSSINGTGIFDFAWNNIDDYSINSNTFVANSTNVAFLNTVTSAGLGQVIAGSAFAEMRAQKTAGNNSKIDVYGDSITMNTSILRVKGISNGGTSAFSLYYDPTLGGVTYGTSSTGNVSSGAQNRLAYYATAGSVLSQLAAITPNSIVVSDANGLPVAGNLSINNLNSIYYSNIYLTNMGFADTVLVPINDSTYGFKSDSLYAFSNKIAIVKNITQSTRYYAIDINTGNIPLSGLGGLLNVSQINASGTLNGSTFLAGDGSWKSVSGGISDGGYVIPNNRLSVYVKDTVTGNAYHTGMSRMNEGTFQNNYVPVFDASGDQFIGYEAMLSTITNEQDNDMFVDSSGRAVNRNPAQIRTILGLSTVATSGAYNDLTGRPSLAAIATSGSAADLIGGTLPTARISGTATEGYYVKVVGGVLTFAAGATGGAVALDDLSDVVITSAAANQVLFNNGSAWINKDVYTINATSIANNDFFTYNSSTTEINNKTPAQVRTILGLATVATSGDYNDLINKPTLYSDEAAQDAIGAMVSSEFTYTDATPLLAINAIAATKITTDATHRFTTDVNTANYQSGFDNQIVSLAVTGTTTKTITLTQQDGGTVTGNFSDLSGSGGIADAYISMTDGTNTSTASGGSTFKYRTANNLMSLVVTDNDATHGDNILFTVNQANITGFGTVTSGTYQATPIVDAYIASASNWNAKQAALTFSNSVVNTSNVVTLVGDAGTPGNSQYYGTNGSGTKGWYALPAPGTSYTFNNGLTNTSGTVGWGGTLSAATNILGASNSLSIGTAASSLNGLWLYSSNIIQLNGNTQYSSASSGDANYTAGSNVSYVQLDAITAARALTMPTGGSGMFYVIRNKNASANAWTFAGTNVKDALGNTVTSIPNGVQWLIFHDGVNWVISDSYNSQSSIGAVTLTSSGVFFNKGIAPRISSTTSTASVTPNLDTDDGIAITAQAAAISFVNPTGTKNNGQFYIVRIKDNATARAISWGTQYRASTNLALPTTTTLSKTMYIKFMANNNDNTMDLVSVLDNF
jgi:hypothetical protein